MFETIGQTIIWIAAIVVGVPVVCVFGTGMIAIIGHLRLKAREMRVKEKHLPWRRSCGPTS